jgi:MFS family permease
VPAYVAAFFATDLFWVFTLWGIGAVLHYSYLGAQYNIGQGVVSNQSRATAIAVLLILVSLIGNGIGPYFVGFMSDFFMQQQLLMLETSTLLSPELCKATDLLPLIEDQALCREANSTGLKYAMAATASIFILASIFLCFVRAHPEAGFCRRARLIIRPLALRNGSRATEHPGDVALPR